MNSLEKMRGVGDLLLYQKRYKEAFIIYDELYKQMWTILATAQNTKSLTLKDVLKIVKKRNDIEQEQTMESVVNSVCLKYYHIDVASFLNEFIKTLYGHLQCICFTSELIKEILIDNVLTEFLVLYMLIIQPENQRRISPIFTVASGVLDENKLKRVRSLNLRNTTEKLLVENVQKNNNREWKRLNNLLLQYLSQVYGSKNSFYSKINAIVIGNYFSTNNYYSDFSKYNSYTYEKYERYERYEKYGANGVNGNYEFNPTLASEEEKKAYYGRLIGLSGRVSKSQVRTKYLELISQYHPDKVQHLGPELRELAERKTKELNIAYNWLRNRYNF